MEQLRTRLEISEQLNNQIYFLIPLLQIHKLGKTRNVRLQGKIDNTTFSSENAIYWDIHNYYFPIGKELLAKINKKAGDDIYVEFDLYSYEFKSTEKPFNNTEKDI